MPEAATSSAASAPAAARAAASPPSVARTPQWPSAQPNSGAPIMAPAGNRLTMKPFTRPRRPFSIRFTPCSSSV